MKWSLVVVLALVTAAHAGPKAKPKAAKKVVVLVVNHSNASLHSLRLDPSRPASKDKHPGQNLIALHSLEAGNELAVELAPGDYDVYIEGTRPPALLDEHRIALTESTQFEVVKGGKVITSKADEKHAAKVVAKQNKEIADAEKQAAKVEKEKATARRDKRHWEIDLNACGDAVNWCGTIGYSSGGSSSCISQSFEDDVTSDTALPAFVEYVDNNQHTRLKFTVKHANVRYKLEDDCRKLVVEPL